MEVIKQKAHHRLKWEYREITRFFIIRKVMFYYYYYYKLLLIGKLMYLKLTGNFFIKLVLEICCLIDLDIVYNQNIILDYFDYISFVFFFE